MTVKMDQAFGCVFGLTVLLVAASSPGQLPTARLLTIFPPGGKAGSTFEVAVTGSDLDEASTIRFSDTNITAKPKLNDVTGLNEPGKFVVSIASDVAPGRYEARVVGRFGISNPRIFSVGVLPELQEKENKSAGSPMEVMLPGTINARTDANAVDYYKFAAKKGERVIVSCEAKAIDSRCEPSLIVCDESGRELERAHQGGFVDFRAARDGQYVLKVHDFLYAGGNEHFYRLSIGVTPWIDFVLPPSAVPGTTNKFVVYGRNLPGGQLAESVAVGGKPLEKVEVEVAVPSIAGAGIFPAKSLALDGFNYRLGGSNPYFISFASGSVILATNGSRESPQKIAPPCEVTGQFFPAADVDFFTFEAKKGEAYDIQVFSDRLGLPTDPIVVIQRAAKGEKGKVELSDVQEFNDLDANTAGPEFKAGSLDCAGKFEAKEDGEYRIQVRDLFSRLNADPRNVYRLSIRKAEPDFRLVALPLSPAAAKKDSKEISVWSSLLRRGDTLPVKVVAYRQNGFDGDIFLGVTGLPAGVSCPESRIYSGQGVGTVLLTASQDASNWAGGISIIGKAKIGDSEISRVARAGTVTWNVPDFNNEVVQSRCASEFAIGVSGEETAPVSIQPAEAKVWDAAPGAKVQIPLKITRAGEFTESVKLKAYGIPALDSFKEVEATAKTNIFTIELDLAQQKIGAGSHVFYLSGQTKGKYSNNPEGAKRLEALAKAAETNAANLAATAKKAAEELAAASKAVTEAEAAAKSATEKEAADAKAKAASEAKAAAEKASAEAEARAKAATAKKEALAAAAKEAAEKAKPKEVTITVYSAPIFLKVASLQASNSAK